MTTLNITPIDDIVPAAPSPNEWSEAIAAIDKLESKAARFVVEAEGEALLKVKRNIRRAANVLNKTAKFGLDNPVRDKKGEFTGHTEVQLKLVPKTAGRPPAGAKPVDVAE